MKRTLQVLFCVCAGALLPTLCHAEQASDAWTRLSDDTRFRPTLQVTAEQAAGLRLAKMFRPMNLVALTAGQAVRAALLSRSPASDNLAVLERWLPPRPDRYFATLVGLRRLTATVLRLAGAGPPATRRDGELARAHLEPMLDFSRVGASVRGQF